MLALSSAASADGSLLPDAVLQIDGHEDAGADVLTADEAVRALEGSQYMTDIVREGTFDSASGPVGWVAVQDSLAGFDGVHYLVTGGGWEWTVTYWTRWTVDGHALGDQMVAGLTPLRTGT
jgi:hypothetical protein